MKTSDFDTQQFEKLKSDGDICLEQPRIQSRTGAPNPVVRLP
jgi:hypothetical protein